MQRALEGRVGAGAEERGQQGIDRVVGQRLQPQHGVRGAAQVEAGRVERRPARHHQQQRALAQPIGQRVHAFDRRRVGPLQILENQHQRTLDQAALEHRAHRHEDLALEPLGLDLARPLDRLQAEDVADHRHHQLDLDVGGADRAQPGFDLAARRFERIGGCDAVRLAEQAGGDAIRPRADRRADDAAHRRVAEPRGAAQPLQQDVDQSRLADARLGNEAQDLRTAFGDAQRGREHVGELGVAADQRRFEPMGGQAAHVVTAKLVDADQPMDLQRFGLPLQGERAGRLERELALRQLVGGLAHQRLRRARRRLQAGRRVHGIAGHGVDRVRRRTEVAGDDPAGVDADVQRERAAELIAPALVEHGRARVHLECRTQRALRIVLVRDRRAEDGDDGIADELFRVGVEAVDHRAQRSEQVGLQAADVLGVEAFGERGEAGEIGEEDGGGAAIGVRRDGRRRRRGRELLPAAGAEGEADRYVELATRAFHRRILGGLARRSIRGECTRASDVAAGIPGDGGPSGGESALSDRRRAATRAIGAR